jgi:hypothetical protein
MFCPVCKAEYRPGFTRCADCDIDLVYELPKSAPLDREAIDPVWGGNNNEERLRVVWQGNDQSECVALCQQLKAARVYYDVAQDVESRSLRMQVSWRYQIGVRSSEYDRAKELLGIEDKPADTEDVKDDEDEDEGSGDPTLELPDTEDSTVEDAISEERVRSSAYLKKWYPEDAIVKVWEQSSEEDFSSAIEVSLKENLIHFRSDLGSEGRPEIYVLPEDEFRAREIVREVVEGILPE